MSQSPGVEYAKQEIQRRVDNFYACHSPLLPVVVNTIEYFAEHLDELYGRLEAQQAHNEQIKLALKAATEAIEALSHRVYMLETYNR